MCALKKSFYHQKIGESIAEIGKQGNDSKLQIYLLILNHFSLLGDYEKLKLLTSQRNVDEIQKN